MSGWLHTACAKCSCQLFYFEPPCLACERGQNYFSFEIRNLTATGATPFLDSVDNDNDNVFMKLNRLAAGWNPETQAKLRSLCQTAT
jgi:hypothetical protein